MPLSLFSMLDNPLDEVFLEKDKLATQPSTAELLPLTEKLLSEVCPFLYLLSLVLNYWEQVQVAQIRLQKLKEEPDCLISTSDLETQDKAYDQAHKLWVGRKKAFKTLLGTFPFPLVCAIEEGLMEC